VKGLRSTVLVGIVALLVLAFGREPVFWKRYFLALLASPGSTASLYEPRERIAGDYQPPAPRVAPELEGLDRKALEAAATYAGERDSSALIVSRHEHIVFEKYWGGTGFDTVEDGQSFARVVAALAFGVALSRRQIHWPEEPIGNFISQWHGDPRGAITVGQLLRMSSGLARPEPSLNPWSASVRASLGPDVLSAALSEPLVSKPGAARVEQSADPQLLALVVERATGMRYAAFVSQALWRPIGAGDAWLWLDRPDGTAHADCCMLARQGDWIRVGELLVRDGNYRGEEVIRPGWVGSYVRLGNVAFAGTEPYALGDVFVVQGSGGNRLWVVPSMHLVILRMGRTRARGADWDDSHIPNLVIRGARDYRAPQARSNLSDIVPGH
jgi:CubicO group peptidase (beta-lactamase class C family)